MAARKLSSRKYKPGLPRLSMSMSVGPENDGNVDVNVERDHPQTSTLRNQLEFWLATSRSAMIIDLANTVLSILACFLYVTETYYENVNQNEVNTERVMSTFNSIEIALSCIFLCDYLLRFVAASKKLLYIFSPQALLDLITILPGFLTLADFGGVPDRSEINLLSIISFFRVLRILKILRLHRLLSFTDSEIVQEVITMVLTVLCIVFVTSGLLHLVENTRSLWPDAHEFHRVEFFSIIYLIVTTITTVGYGDVVPMTVPGKLIIILMMTTAIVLVPRQTNKLIALMALTSVYGRQRYRTNSHTEHVIVCGAVHFGGVVEFFQELFHPDHGNLDLHAVIIGRGLPSVDIQALLSDPTYAYHLTYLDGNVMNEKDLKRAQAQHAKAFFVLANKFSLKPEEEDASTILRALSLKRFVQREKGGRDVMTCVQLINPESKKLFLSSTARGVSRYSNLNHIVCLDEVKMNLLAKSCLCPGMSTMICNLISSGDEDVDDNDPKWVQEYVKGCGFEIYRVRLSESFEGLSFLDASQSVRLSFLHLHSIRFGQPL